MFRETDNSVPAFHRNGGQRLREGDPPKLTHSPLPAACSAQTIVRRGNLILRATRLTARKTEIRKRAGISVALLFLMLPSAALAQETSAKAQPGNKALPSGDGNGSRDKQSAASIDPNYVIAPQDTLDISVWKEPDLTRTVPVRPDGKISLPLLDDVQAGGLTPPQLAAEITQKLKKYLTDPRVTVIVTTIANQRVYVLGEVTRAGAYPLLSGMTLLQALSSAGGFTQFANPKNIYLLRVENGKQIKHAFNYKDVVNGKNLDQNLELKSGDTIVVP
jgi:polysaccharide biosynthesis/export protein